MPAKKRTERRAKGEGHYWYEDATGQHRYRIRKDGKTHFVSDKNPKRAKEKFRLLKKALDEGIKVDEGKQTFAEYARSYLETAIRVGENTRQDYGRRLGYYINPWIGDYPIDTLITRMGEAWIAALQNEGKAISNIAQCLRLAQRILDRAVAERLIPYNPFTIIKPPREEQDESDDDEEEGRKSFTLEQEQALLADAKAHDKHWSTTMGTDGRKARGQGTYLFYLLALRLGLRRGELLGLRRKDVDFDNRIIRIRQQVVQWNNEVKVTRRLKSIASRRDLPLLDEVAAVLRPHLLRLGGGDTALLFPGKKGGAKHPSAVTAQFNRALVRIGAPGFSLHDCRHTAITRWRERRVDAETTAALAGHQKPDVMAEIYSEVSMDRKRKAVEG